MEKFNLNEVIGKLQNETTKPFLTKPMYCIQTKFTYQQKIASEKKYLEAFKNNHWANLLILITAILCYVT